MPIISDIATLVKAGFTIDDIKEIVKADKAPAGDTITPGAKAPEAPEAPKAPEPETGKDPEPEPDYKALYEKSQDDLKKAQAQNTKENIAPEPLKINDVIANIKKEIC